LCGFQDLSREERLSRANEILNSTELKQSICHKILGCTFKDIEKTMIAVIQERQITEAQAEQLELEEMAPEKFDPEVTFRVNREASNVVKKSVYGTYTKEQVAKLLAASKAPIVVSEPLEPTREYPILSREQCEALMREYFKYKIQETERKEEEEWALVKTTESEAKTESTMKHSTSTKT
jgi:hypothetical protein